MGHGLCRSGENEGESRDSHANLGRDNRFRILVREDVRWDKRVSATLGRGKGTVRRKNVTGLTYKRDEWSMNAPDDNSSDKTQSFESDVRLPVKNTANGGMGEDVAENETCWEFLEPVRRFRARLMDGRRTFGALGCASCLFTGKLGSSGMYPRRKLQNELQLETKCALKGAEREIDAARSYSIRIKLRGVTQRRFV